MIESEKPRQRELVVRVATLELLVADLIHLARQYDAEAVDRLAIEAARDLDAQESRSMPSDTENQRFRPRRVLDSRARSLTHHRFSSRLAVQRHASTD